MAIHPGLNSRYIVESEERRENNGIFEGYVDHIRFRNEDNGYTD